MATRSSRSSSSDKDRPFKKFAGHVTVTGNLTRDPFVSDAGIVIATIAINSNDGYKDDDEGTTCFWSIKAFPTKSGNAVGKAEYLASLSKGDSVLVSGPFYHDPTEYEDKDGNVLSNPDHKTIEISQQDINAFVTLNTTFYRPDEEDESGSRSRSGRSSRSSRRSADTSRSRGSRRRTSDEEGFEEVGEETNDDVDEAPAPSRRSRGSRRSAPQRGSAADYDE